MAGDIPPVSPSCGVFIAGGCVRRWFTGKEPLSDIDVFAPSEKGLLEFIGKLGNNLEPVYETQNADTYLVKDCRIQLIKFHYSTAEELVNNFDFNVCQFVWTETGIFATQKAIIGTLRGHLSVNRILKNFAADSLRRAFKYQLNGFLPCAGTIRDLATSFVELTPEEIKAQIELSPKGGNRIVRFD